MAGQRTKKAGALAVHPVSVVLHVDATHLQAKLQGGSHSSKPVPSQKIMSGQPRHALPAQIQRTCQQMERAQTCNAVLAGVMRALPPGLAGKLAWVLGVVRSEPALWSHLHITEGAAERAAAAPGSHERQGTPASLPAWSSNRLIERQPLSRPVCVPPIDLNRVATLSKLPEG
ncbi:hypothetical protein ACKKBG_A07640 [Auxenochlorella protothecoides x Auxenochlorella symbiontica]|uniref:Uncharacterized protein n=1 Tax=Auxenochlorella protothecoides TaxID=3075 RepID=A0A1D1ZVS6_AUXPR